MNNEINKIPEYLVKYKNRIDYIEIAKQLSGKKHNFEYFKIVTRYVLFNFMLVHLKNHPLTLKTLLYSFQKWLLKLPKSLNS
jgi:hypothetical protein